MNLADKPAFKNSLRRRTQMRNARMRYWLRQSEKFLPDGLTTRGTKRIYQLHPELCKRGKSGQWKRKMRARIYRALDFKPKKLTPMQSLYNELRGGISIGPGSVEDIGWSRYELEKENHFL